MKEWFTASRRIGSAIAAFSTALTFNLWMISPTLAADPFRATNQRQIGAATEAAFRAVFDQGNYPAAQGYLERAESSEPNEPLVYAMKASLGYTVNQDSDVLSSYGKKTLETAQELINKDPLRGNLYAAVGHFLQGAAVLVKDGTVKGTPQALSELRQVYQYLDKAEAVSPTDPELNLVRGYMDLMIAVNLPFSNPEQAIERLEKRAGPRYLADRGLAIGYRDLNQYTDALKNVNIALQSTPNNPELSYLKAQILAGQTNFQEADNSFKAALAKSEQLPKRSVAQMFYEMCKNQNRIDNKDRSCDALRDGIKKVAGNWGPKSLPPLN